MDPHDVIDSYVHDVARRLPAVSVVAALILIGCGVGLYREWTRVRPMPAPPGRQAPARA